MRRAAAVKARQRKVKDDEENEAEVLADTSTISSESKTPKSAGRKGGRNRKGGTGKQKQSDDKSDDLNADSKGNESGEDKNSDLEEKYEVEKIVDMKVIRGVKKYRIRWKGYESDSDTWETEENLNCPDALKEYLEMNTVQNEVAVKKGVKKRGSKVAETSEESAVDAHQETLNNGSPKDEEMTPPKKKKRLSEKPKSAKKQNETDNVGGEYDADDDYDRKEDDKNDEGTSEEVASKKQKVKTKTKSMVKESTTVDSESESGLKIDEPSQEEIGAKKKRGKTAKTKPMSKKSEELDGDQSEGKTSDQETGSQKQRGKPTKPKSGSKKSEELDGDGSEEKAGDESYEEIGAKKQRGKSAKSKSVSKKSEEQDGDESEEKTSDEAYEVEKIMEVHHKKNGKKEYLIHWRGYPHSQDTWEPEEHLDCEELIRAFEEKVNKAKDLNVPDLRTDRAHTSRFAEEEGTTGGKRQSKRGKGKRRATYFDAE